MNVNVFKADILDYRLNTHFDILYSSGVLHYIKPQFREELFVNYKQYTNKNGLHVFNVFVSKPFIPQAPDKESSANKWISGELFMYYHDWLIRECNEFYFDCNSSGIKHKHAMNTIIVEKK